MDVRRLLSAMALEVQALESPAEAIDRIAHYARVAVDADESGILLVKARGRVETPAATSDKIAKAHSLQAELDEGPCLDAIRGDEPVLVSKDVTTDTRWPVWGTRVAGLGYHSVVSVRLDTSERSYGSLNAYSAGVDAFTSQDVEVMEILAAHASVAIAASQAMDNMQTALSSRTTIGQAQGILMAVYDLDPEGAFQYLRRLSQHGNTRLADVCEQVIAQRHELRKQIDV
jgi:GAF domain-containing protein